MKALVDDNSSLDIHGILRDTALDIQEFGSRKLRRMMSRLILKPLSKFASNLSKRYATRMMAR